MPAPFRAPSRSSSSSSARTELAAALTPGALLPCSSPAASRCRLATTAALASEGPASSSPRVPRCGEQCRRILWNGGRKEIKEGGGGRNRAQLQRHMQTGPNHTHGHGAPQRPQQIPITQMGTQHTIQHQLLSGFQGPRNNSDCYKASKEGAPQPPPTERQPLTCAASACSHGGRVGCSASSSCSTGMEASRGAEAAAALDSRFAAASHQLPPARFEPPPPSQSVPAASGLKRSLNIFRFPSRSLQDVIQLQY